MNCKVCGVELICGENCYRSCFRGFNFYCKKCWNEMNKKYNTPEKHREACRRYRERNPNKDHEYYEANKEKIYKKQRERIGDKM